MRGLHFEACQLRRRARSSRDHEAEQLGRFVGRDFECWSPEVQHEIKTLRGLLGDPEEIRSSSLSPACVGVNLRFGDAECHLSWVDLPGIAHYQQDFAFYTPDQRLTLRLPSPFLRSTPGEVLVEGGEPGTSTAWIRREVISYEEGFKRELAEFADCIATGREPRTSGRDAVGDLRVCEAIVRAHRDASAPVALDWPVAVDAQS